MKIIHTIAGFGVKSGGTSTCTYDLLSAMRMVAPGMGLELLTPDVTDAADRLMGDGEEWIRALPNDCKTPVAYSAQMVKALMGSDADVYHTNGMWLHVNHVTCAEARAKHKPYVITPHGMLYPETLRLSYWKKWPMLKLWFNRDLMKADCIHATCWAELEHLRSFGYPGPIALIGNPVPVEDYVSSIFNDREMHLGEDSGKKALSTIGFLGRLHPRKHVERILSAIALRGRGDVKLVIMGSGDAVYETFLRNEARRLGIADRVEFTGFVTGREKFERLAGLSALFVPSDMENFGMIIPEALLVGTPVMASLGTPWKTLNDNRCGWWTDNSPESIAMVIDSVVSATPRELFGMGARGRQMVLERFEAKEVAKQMIQLYNWLADGGKKPDFVYTD